MWCNNKRGRATTQVPPIIFVMGSYREEFLISGVVARALSPRQQSSLVKIIGPCLFTLGSPHPILLRSASSHGLLFYRFLTFCGSDITNLSSCAGVKQRKMCVAFTRDRCGMIV